MSVLNPPTPSLKQNVARHVRVFSKHFPKNINTISVDRLSKFIFEMWECDNIYEVQEEVSRLFSRREYIKILKDNPGVEQRTPAWYAIRKLGLTASDLAQANNKGKFGNREQLLLKKLGLVSDDLSEFAKTTVEHGVMFEDMALRCYRARNQDVHVYDFGLMPHQEIKGFGASPDGITEWGRMIEIKCPPKRPLTGTVPEHYYLQMQGQMAVAGLTEADFVEAKIEVVDLDDFLLLPDEPTSDAGVALRFSIKKDGLTAFEYAYSESNLTPRQAVEWAHIEAIARMENESNLELSKMAPWKLNRMDIQYVTFNTQLWNDECLPVIDKFIADLNDARIRVGEGFAPWDGYEEKLAQKVVKAGLRRASSKKTEELPDFEDDSDDERA